MGTPNKYHPEIEDVMGCIESILSEGRLTEVDIKRMTRYPMPEKMPEPTTRVHWDHGSLLPYLPHLNP